MKNRMQGSSWVPLIVYLAIIVLSVCGWVANVVKLIGSDFDPLTGLVVARAFGVFVAPLGVVLGYF